MDCEKAARRAHLYLDRELTVWRRFFVRRHLVRCPPCARAYEFEVEVRTVVSARCRDELPEDVRQRVLQRLRDLQSGAGRE
jgi:mycothiol system anti-sigma-R factor